VRDVDLAVAAMSRALGSIHDVSSAAFDPAGKVFLRLEGFAPSIAARLAALRREQGAEPRVGEIDVLEGDASRACWRALGSASALDDAAVVWRLSVPPSHAARVIETLDADRYVLDWGGGLLWLAADTVDASRVRAAVREGHATLIKAPAEARATSASFHPQPAALEALLARVKSAFDPMNRLNPGRMR
jgi:glycolate oxidase FAD binding subunit